MKYVLVGTLAPESIGCQKERVEACRAKAEDLGITFESIYYTQGVYDFVDVIEASDTYVILGFSLWYTKQGFGRFTTMPAYDEETMITADGMA